MKTYKFYTLIINMAFCSVLFLSSCNNDVNETNLKTDQITNQIITSPTTLTIIGKISRYLPSSIDSLKAFNFNNKKLMGACSVASDGSFKMIINPIYDSSDTIGRIHNTGYTLWMPNPINTSNNKAVCIILSGLSAYRNGNHIYDLRYYKRDNYIITKDSAISSSRQTSFIYCNSSISFSKNDTISESTNPRNLYFLRGISSYQYNYQLNNGWTEVCNENKITTYTVEDNNRKYINNYIKYSNNVPADLEWSE